MSDHLAGLNDAQKEAVLATDGPLLILAGAGAGKTRVITHRIAEIIRQGRAAPHEILAVTFTNKAAKEMRERVAALLSHDERLSLTNVPRELPFVSTFHSLGVHIIKENAGHFGLTRHFTIYDRDDSRRAVKAAIIDSGFDPKELEPRRALSAISRAKGDGMGLAAYRERFDGYFENAIAEIWEKYDAALRKEKALDFDDLLLKTVELLRREEKVRARYQRLWKYIHVDEYQDTNVVQYELIRWLAAAHQNLCVVGDADQCLAPGTRIRMSDGAERVIEKIREGDSVLSNYGSGDMRAARICAVRVRTAPKELIRIETESGAVLTSTPEHMHIAGYKLGVTPQFFFTYLMHKRGVGWRIGVSQVYTKGQKRAVIGLVQRCNHEHADEAWIIAVHKKPNDARVLEYILSLTYKIPTLPFVARKGLSVNGYVHDQNMLAQVFASFDTEKNAAQLLQDRRLSREYPHHRAQSRNSNRRNIVVTLCGDHRGKTPMHRIAMVGNDSAGRKALQSAGFSVRPAKKDSASWRFETASSDYGELLADTARLKEIFPEAHITEMARLGKTRANMKEGNSLPFMPASSLTPGMALFNAHGNYEIIKTITKEKSSCRTVYDLDVEKTHNFVANGIVTHNCIYSWRGATIENIFEFEREYPAAKTILLTENYRSTKVILEASNAAIAKNRRRKEKVLTTENPDGEKISLCGVSDETSEARFVAGRAGELIRRGANPDDIAVLYRANFQSRALEEAFLASGIPYQVLGTRFFERKEVKDAISYLRAALNGESTSDIARIANVPVRGIGKVTLLAMLENREATLASGAREKVLSFRNLLVRMREVILKEKASDVLRFVVRESGIERALIDGGTEEDLERLENVKELVTLATKYDGYAAPEGIEKLIEEAALQSDQDELREKEEAKKKPGVKLMTVHAAKGLEFEYVFITGLEDGLFPHERDDEGADDEEERRLFYVALTRAKKRVFLTYALTRRIFGTPVVGMPSEFITEMDPALVEVEQLGSGYEEFLPSIH